MVYNFNFRNNLDLFISIIESLSLLFSFFFIGFYLFKYTGLRYIFKFRYNFFNYILFGNIFTSFLLYYYTFFFGIRIHDIQLISYFLFFFTTISISYNTKKIKLTYLYIYSKIKYNNDLKLIFICLFGFFLLCLAPVTGADALDYHLGFPKELLKFHQVIFRSDWFTLNLAGINEYVLLLSVGLKAEQFGSLLQFFSLLSVIGIFFNTVNFNDNNKYISIWIIFTFPVLLYLISSPKPQLTSIALSCNLFFITCFNYVYTKKRDIIIIFSLLFYLSLTKLNFILSLIFLSILFLRNIIQKINYHLYKKIFLIIFTGLIIYYPFLSYKINNSKQFTDLIYPIPSYITGSEDFITSIKNYKESLFSFPFSLIIPSSLSNYTTILGFNLLIIFFILYHANYKNNIFIFIFIFIICSYFLGQNTSRFFLEPTIWTIILLFYINTNNYIYSKYIKYILTIEASFLFIIFIYSFFNLTIGSFNLNIRENILKKNANGYQLAAWVNKKIPANVNSIVDHRSLFLFNQNTFFINSINLTNKDTNKTIDFIKNNDIQYIVKTSSMINLDNVNIPYSKLLYGPYQYKVATRNPFSNGSFQYAWIYKTNITENAK